MLKVIYVATGFFISALTVAAEGNYTVKTTGKPHYHFISQSIDQKMFDEVLVKWAKTTLEVEETDQPVSFKPFILENIDCALHKDPFLDEYGREDMAAHFCWLQFIIKDKMYNMPMLVDKSPKLDAFDSADIISISGITSGTKYPWRMLNTESGRYRGHLILEEVTDAKLLSKQRAYMGTGTNGNFIGGEADAIDWYTSWERHGAGNYQGIHINR